MHFVFIITVFLTAFLDPLCKSFILFVLPDGQFCQYMHNANNKRSSSALDVSPKLSSLIVSIICLDFFQHIN